MRGEMSDLIARLEAAEAGSRELDADIAKAVDQPHGEGVFVYPESRSYEVHAETARRYTTSLDAALSLIPRHSLWIVGQQEDAIARVLPPTGNGWTGSKEITATARTPALALCIAALRARAPAPGSQT